jgi:anti-sigma regulatory factor (Ser/Thr protein kinase)
LDDVLTVCELPEVPLARARFVAHLGSIGIEGDELHGWALTFTELVNNAIEHGCSQPGDVIRIRWWQEQGDVVVSVTDPSVGSISAADFDCATCDGFEDTGRGAGLFLIRAWVDEVTVSPGATGGTEVRIRRHRDGAGGAAEERGGGRGAERGVER